MQLFLLTLLFMAIALWQVPGLIMQKQWRELIVFAVLLGTGFAISLLLQLDIELPRIGPLTTQLVRMAVQMVRSAAGRIIR